MTDFNHYVITRFNTRINERASDDWLRHRLGYFEKVCHASVKSQTVQDFEWLVYFDAERDQWFEDEVNRLAAGVFTPVWVEGKFSPADAAAEVTRRASRSWIITTRVDNDDALARDFLERVQGSFAATTEFINFTAGLQLTDDGRVFHRSDPSNAFISLIEPLTDKPLMGVYVAWHDRVSTYAPVRQVTTHPMWVQMVHGKNIANSLRGIRADPLALASHFDIGVAAVPVSRVALLGSQALSAASLGLRVARKPHRIVWAFKVLRARLGLG
ncbi:hypothetical protein ASF72_06935 [Arthrobacter sp. Leaf141]|uniref:glycosyltransferase n=1 Tax=Arthrobacter sp. Leaf141 TaxID=1736273 RepID=UPI000714FDEF|nr:glycosyltransferase [Arthrobacter sp. Leaf141]KQR02921.1 hypothetical protein ASF72_06935 [Arthrobacter sp. Leaf141]